jgi:hypothetical protein
MAQPRLPVLDSGFAGPPTQVLTLGTVHLRGAPAGFEPASLQPVIDRLAAFRPDLITIEHIPGEQCEAVARLPTAYEPESWRRYCPDPTAARASTGLDFGQAVAEIERTLAHWPAQPGAAQRRRLAAVFLAAGDRGSALVQWLHLPAAERRAGDGLDEGLVAGLEEVRTSNDETSLIAAPLAVRLGLQRLYPTDDHTGDTVDVADEAGFVRAIEQMWRSAAAPAQPLRDQEAALWRAGDMLALYRLINSPRAQRIAAASDQGAARYDGSPQHYGRIYVAGWETRNLRMVANVAAAFRGRPGARVLSIVGASHKPWFDGLLGQLQGVRVIDAGRILK